MLNPTLLWMLWMATPAVSPAATSAYACDPTRDPPPGIYVLTIGPGDELFARFGHIGLVVADGDVPARVYNFGTFAFDDPGLQLEYLRGHLTYWLSVSGYRQTLEHYQQENRAAVVRTLDLTATQVAEVAARLAHNALPEHRAYAYRHYLDNCSTRIRDLLDDVLGGLLSRASRKTPTGRTFRDWTRQALVGMPLVGNAIDFLLGPTGDRPIDRWQEYFLPAPFSQDLDRVRLGARGGPLVIARCEVLDRRGPAVGVRVDWVEWWVLAAVGALLLVGFGWPVALGRRRFAARLVGLGLVSWGALAGLGGLTLALLWAWTDHTDMHANENLLVTPLTHLWLLAPGCKLLWSGRLGARTGRWVFWYLVSALELVVIDAALKLGPLVQDNWRFIGLAAAVDGLALMALVRAGLVGRTSIRSAFETRRS